MEFRLWFSKAVLTSRSILWALFWINLLGTLYGYIWYGNQLQYTAAHMPSWIIPFVPDSPTASLFFTGSILFLLYAQDREWKVRGFIDAFGAVTSVKYGIWAVAMIFAGAVQGDPVDWQEWMLSGSHLGMAAEAFLYVRFFRIRWVHFVLVGIWVFLNDFLDYNVFHVYPWLPKRLEDDLPLIEAFTFGLSFVSLAAIALYYFRKHKLV